MVEQAHTLCLPRQNNSSGPEGNLLGVEWSVCVWGGGEAFCNIASVTATEKNGSIDKLS